MNDLNDTLEKKEMINEINASIKKLEDKNAFRLCAVVVLIAICAIFAIIGAFVNTEAYWMVIGLFVFLPCGLAIICFSVLIYETYHDIKLVNKKMSEMKKGINAIHDQPTGDLIKCKKCGYVNIANRKYCAKCHQPLVGTPFGKVVIVGPNEQGTVYRKCDSCGKINEKDDIYCAFCGNYFCKFKNYVKVKFLVDEKENEYIQNNQVDITEIFDVFPENNVPQKSSTFYKNETSATNDKMESDTQNIKNKEKNPHCENMTKESRRIYLSFRDYGVDLLAEKHIITYQLSKIDPFDFEKFVANLFSSIGYRAHATKASGDYGCDVVAEKDSIRLAIQCKHREDPGATVDQKAVREIHAAKDVSEYRADKAFVVTNGKFTPAAKKLAYDLRVGLWDCEDLLKKLNDIKNTFQFIEPKEGE